MVKRFKSKFLIILILSVLMTSVVMPVKLFATTSYMDPHQFDNSSYTQVSDAQVSDTLTFGELLFRIGGFILNLVRIVALSWAILMLIAIAIKYMSGNAQVKAQLKTDVPTYLIGAVILFGASGILTLIKYFMDDNFS